MPIKDRDRRRLPLLGKIRLGYLEERKRRDGSKYTFPRQADHFILKDAQRIQDWFAEQGITKPRELDVILPFPTLQQNYDASYMVWANGVLLCKGDGEHVLYANPMRVAEDAKGVHVYNEAGPTLVVDGVAQTTFKWGEIEYTPGEIVNCPGSAGPEFGHPHCAACKMSAILKVTPYDPELFQFGYYQITTGSWRNHQTIMGTLESLPPVVFEKKLPFTLRMVQEQTTYTDDQGKRHATERWFLQLMPHPDMLRALFQRQQHELVTGESKPAELPAPRVSVVPLEAEPPDPPPYAEVGAEMGVRRDVWVHEGPPPDEHMPDGIDPEEEGWSDEAYEETRSPPREHPGDSEPIKPVPQEEPAGPPAGRPYDPETLQRRVGTVAGSKRMRGSASTAQIGLIRALCGHMWDNVNDHLPRLLDYLLSVQSPEHLSKAQAAALIDWLRDPDSPDGQHNLYVHAKTEAAQVIRLMLKREGQQSLPGME